MDDTQIALLYLPFVMIRMMTYASLFAVMASSVSPALAAETGQPWPIRLRDQMARVADVGFKLSTTAAPLCPQTRAGTGISIDYIRAYSSQDRAAISELLGLSDLPQIAAVAPDSPAQAAGLQTGDDIIAIAGTPVSTLLARSKDPSLLADELESHLAALPVDTPFTIQVKRQGQTLNLPIQPRPICSARIVINTSKSISAHSDGDDVAVSSKLIDFTINNDELALILGHELGHVIHQDKDISSLQERRNAEDKADLAGLKLAVCSGYDAETAFQFWYRRDAEDWLRMLRAPTHRGRKTRVALMREELPKITCPAPSV